MSGDTPAYRLRAALDVVVGAGAVPDVVRDEIGASWQRSARSGLTPDHFEVPVDREAVATEPYPFLIEPTDLTRRDRPRSSG
jgi:hypothetical protein